MSLRLEKKLPLGVCALLVLGALVTPTSAQSTFTWINPVTGFTWSDPSSWKDINGDTVGDVAEGADNIADFSTLDLTANNTLTIDGDHTLGKLIFGDMTPSNNWIVAGTNILTLSTTVPGTTPTITVNNQTTTFNNVLAGTQGFNKEGAGSLILGTSNSTITGPININGGTFGILAATGSIPASVQINMANGSTFNLGSANGNRNVAMATQVNIVNAVGSNSTTATLAGTGFTNAATGGTAAVINYQVIGSGNVNWSFLGSTGLNIINNNMFANYGGTVNFTVGQTTRVAAGNSTQTMPFATINLGTSTGGFTTRASNNTTFIMGGLSGGNVTVLGANTTGATPNTLVVGSANASQTFTGGLFQSATSTTAPVVTKVGTGTWTIAPSAVYGTNAFSFNANGGNLVANYQNLTTATNLVRDTSTLSFGGGTFTVLAKNTGATAQTFGNVTVNSGGGELVVDTNGGTGATLTLGNLTATAIGGALNIRPTGSAAATITTTSAPDATGTYGGEVTFTSAAGATEWAASASAAAPFTLSGYTAYALLPPAATDSTNDLASGNVTLTGAVTTNSLKVTSTAAGQALNLGTNALTLTNGGVLATGANAYAINGGTITSGQAATPSVAVHAHATGALTIGSAIVDSAVGPTAFTKAGPGTVILTGNNTFTGQAFLTSGITSISTDRPLGGGNGTISIAVSDVASASVTLASATLPAGFGVGSSLLGRTVTAINGTDVTLADVANTTLANQSATWANAPQVNLNGGILSASANLTLEEAATGGATPASTARRNLIIGSGGGTLDVASGANLTVSGAVNSTGNQRGPLVKTGPGTLTVAATPAVNFNITTVNGTTLATVDSATGLAVGQTITGTGVPNNATIAAIDPIGLTVTLSANANADGTNPAAAYTANNYGGATIISGGTLSTAILVNGGINSGLGSSAAAAPALVLDGGFLRYTGSGGVSGTTNRTFTLTANGGGLDATGNTGPVVFSSTAPIVADSGLAGTGSRTFTLTGSSTLGNTFAGQIIDGAGTDKTNLVKSGAGTWILSNPSSTFTGTTKVSGGVLKLAPATPSTNNIASSSTVTIDSGTTMDVLGLTGGTIVVGGTQNLIVNGTLTGAVTVPLGGNVGGSGTIANAGNGLVSVLNGGKVSPGSSVGTLSVDKLALADQSILNYEFQTSPAISNDQINTGNLTLAGGFNLLRAGTTAQLSRTGTYPLIKYTGTLTGFDGTWSAVSGTNSHVLNPLVGLTYGFSTTANPGFLSVIVGGVAPAEWLPDDSSHNWSDVNSWSANPPNGVGALASFLTAITAPRTVNVDTPQTVGVITFNNTNSYKLAGPGKITFAVSGAGVAQINDNLGSHEIAAPIGLTSNLTVEVTGAGDTMTFSGGIPTATSALIAKTGPGTLSLSGTNNYSGGTNITGGTVQFSSLASLGTGSVTLNGGALKWNGNSADVSSLFVILTSNGGTLDTNGNNVTFNNSFGGFGSGQLTKAGAGKLILNGGATYTGGTSVTGGTLQIGNNNTQGALAAGNVTLAAGTSLDFNRTDDLTIANNIGGASGTVNKNNANVLTLSGTNTFGTTAGGINLNGGTLRAGSNTAIVNTALTMAPSTTLDLNGFNASIRSLASDNTNKIANNTPDVHFNVTTTNTSNSATVDIATGLAVGQTIVAAGIPNNSTITSINGTTITLSNNATASATVPAVNSTTLTLNLATNTTYAGLLNNSTDGTGVLALTKSGIGTLSLTNDSSMTGAVTVTGGTLQLNAGGKLDHVGAVTVASGTSGTLAVGGGSLTSSALSNLNNANGTAFLNVASGTANFTTGLNALGNGNTVFLINVTGGTLNASTLTMGRTTENFGAQPAAGATGTGLYIQGGTVNIGSLNMGTNNGANSTVSTRIDGGTLNLSGPSVVGLNNGGRWSVLDVNNGGTLNSTDTATGVQLGFTTAGPGELLVRGTGVANVEKVQFGPTTADVGTGVVAVGFNPAANSTVAGGTLNVGAGGMSRGFPVVPGVQPTMVAQVQLGENALITAKADFSSDADWLIGGTTNGPTIQAADAQGVPHNIKITGNLNNAGTTSGIKLTKTGGGTLSIGNGLGASTNQFNGSIFINEGALKLTAADALTLVPSLNLATGTTFGTGGKGQIQLGTFAIAGNATLDIGAGGTGDVHFANSSTAANVTWGGNLTITNWTNGLDHLFFGFDGSALDAAQVSKITFAGLGAAKINAATGEVSPVTPGPSYVRFDVDNNGHVNGADITALLGALKDLNAYKTTKSLDDDKLISLADLDSDGAVTNADLQGLITLLVNGGGSSTPAVPEPATFVLAGFGLAALIAVRRRGR